MKTNLVKDTQKIARFARALAAQDYLMGYIEHERKQQHRYIGHGHGQCRDSPA